MQTETISKQSFFSGLLTLQKEFVKAAPADAIDINEMRPVKLRGKSILLCRSERGFFALQDKCSYSRAQLSEGVMINGTIQCIKHGCQYSAESGYVKKGPARKDIKTYKTLIKDGYIFVEV